MVDDTKARRSGHIIELTQVLLGSIMNESASSPKHEEVFETRQEDGAHSLYHNQELWYRTYSTYL